MSFLRLLMSAATSDAPYVQGAKVDSTTPADNANFGGVVALSGDGLTMASVGVYGGGDDKSIYVFVRSASTWTIQQKITVSDPGFTFGLTAISISNDGNTLVVGSPYRDDGSNIYGAVWVYVRSAGVWSLQQKITGSAGDLFGKVVSITPAGTTIAVGSEGDGLDQGAVFVYTVSGVTWSLQQKLTASDGAISDYFGQSVAVAGNTLVAGAPGQEDAETDGGACYVFTRSGSTWTQQVKLKASPLTSNGSLGANVVAISADETAIAAYAITYDDSVACSSGTPGAIYAWHGSGASWTQMDYYTLGCRGVGPSISFASDGKTLLVRLILGGAHLLVKNGLTWTKLQAMQPSPTQASDAFGSSVAISADSKHIVIGAPNRDTGIYTNSGSVFYFYR